MDIVQLQRDKIFPDSTFGTLIAKGEVFYSLELPWKRNQRNVSCIPEGDYRCIFREKTPTHKNVYEITNVPDRSGILIHVGNYPHDIKGCIALGTGRVFDGDGHMVTHSAIAIEKFNSTMGKKDFILSISYYPTEEV